MNHCWIANTWINALLKEFELMQLDLTVLTQDLPGFEQGRLSTDERLDLLSARLLWHRAEKLSNDPLLGAKVGLANNQRSIGVLAPLLWHSPSIATALQNIARFQTLISENGAFIVTYEEVSDEVKCTYEETPAALKSSTQQILSVAVGCINTIETLSGGQVTARKLTVPTGLQTTPFKKLLGIDVISEGSSVSFSLDKALINHPIAGCDHILYNRCLDYANNLLNEKTTGTEVIQKVRRYIANHGMVAAETKGCAMQLNTYPRNLQRQLASYGTSFRKIKDTVLKEKAIAEFHDGTEVKDIALTLGYSELSGFYRAFKGWFAMTPKKALKDGYFN